MKNVAFIINPNSSNGKYQPFVTKLQQYSSESIIYISESIDGTKDFIKKKSDSIDVFVAVGGDGTISTIA
ncbi:MAG: diacylglycerol kinase, partial [Bacteroidetes bacterium]|nr:diacylglycerol kinase [Bacteroidota bacterium]